MSIVSWLFRSGSGATSVKPGQLRVYEGSYSSYLYLVLRREVRAIPTSSPLWHCVCVKHSNPARAGGRLKMAQNAIMTDEVIA